MGFSLGHGFFLSLFWLANPSLVHKLSLQSKQATYEQAFTQLPTCINSDTPNNITININIKYVLAASDKVLEMFFFSSSDVAPLNASVTTSADSPLLIRTSTPSPSFGNSPLFERIPLLRRNSITKPMVPVLVLL
jgi:hypothetical protein